MTTWTLSNGGASAINFRGNPNVTISAIDTSGGIACSRTSGKTPCFIMVSASAITATGTSTPYEDLSYFWNFGDASGTETFTNPATGQSVNANNGQTGPEAAYCYRSAGTYTVTLTIIGKNGSGYVSATKTQSITITAWSPANTWYYDANATGANNGTSAANAYTALTTISANVNGATGDTQIYLAKGSHWTSTAFIDINKTTGLRISPTPASVGASPIMECATETSSATTPLLGIRTTSSSSCADIVVSNVDFKISGTQFTNPSVVSAIQSNAGQSLANIYLDNCSITTDMASSSADSKVVLAAFNAGLAGGAFDGFGIWGGSINSLPGDAVNGIGCFGGAYNWTFYMGLSNVNGSGGATFNVLNHHFYASVGSHCLFRWINFGTGAENATRNYCIKIDNYNPPKLPITGFGAGSGGVVRVTVSGDATQFQNGGNVFTELVTGTGAADMTGVGFSSGSGVWVGTVIDGTHIDLAGTTYNAGHSYSGGYAEQSAGANYFLVDGNNVTGTNRAFDSNNNLGNINGTWQANYVVQNNAVHDMPYDTGVGSFPICTSLTYRDNRQWRLLNRPVNFGQGAVPPKNHAVIYRIYRNKSYTEASVTGAGSQTDAIVTFGASGVSWTNPQTFTDNIMVDMRSNAGLVGLDSFASDAAWTVDRNQYYAPNATASKFMYDGVTNKTLAQWKATGPNLFDANPHLSYPSAANYGDPGWTVPPTQWSDFG